MSESEDSKLVLKLIASTKTSFRTLSLAAVTVTISGSVPESTPHTGWIADS